MIDRRGLIGGAGALGLAATSQATAKAVGQAARQPSIDVHTHMFTDRWLDLVRKANDKDSVVVEAGGRLDLDYRGQRIITFVPEMLDWDMRVKNMTAAGVDVAVVSLTAPSVHIGNETLSATLAKTVNDDFAEAQRAHPTRIRWLAAIPWEYPAQAVAELERAKAMGAVGVGTITNIRGKMLIEPQFRPVWAAVHRLKMPVFIHPTVPYINVDAVGMGPYGLANTIGFTADTSICFLRMILDGFLDEFPGLDLIACHGGGTLPYLSGRADRMWEAGASARKISRPPSSYLKQLWYDSVVYDLPTLKFLIEQVGLDRVMYGSDYPFRIGDMPGILARVDALPPTQARAVRGANAARLFNL